MRKTHRIGYLLFGVGLWVAACTGNLARRVRRDERGDVPGWVMITLMSALLVAALLAIAGPRLQELFNQAIDSVSGLG
ncbi:hypothetical protein [Paeniglutamicibacter sp. NPDC091659]|uniref:hypothetical protein n=1 Tax=Paeniglutamicibacter sp. NPDC091659 TaxID=3364389 RepID=UPI0037F8DC28